MIKEYWNLIGRDTFLATTWEPDFSQAWSFCRVLMSHMNFHFTQIPEKSNDNFLKKSKNHILGSFFTIFAQWGFFPENLALSNTPIYEPPNTMLSFRKTKEPILRKLTDRQKDRRMDGWADPILQEPSGQGWGSKNTIKTKSPWILNQTRVLNILI